MHNPSHEGAPLGWLEIPESGSRGRRPCPPHGPLLAEAVEEGVYVIKCLACGLWGPEREDSLQAKLAFDQTFRTAL